MNIVPNLESFTWKAQANASVGGPKPYVPPDEYETNVIPAEVEREFIIAGPAYTDALFSTFAPIRPNTGKLALQFEYMIDQNTLDDSQALEFDSRGCIKKLGMNWSNQLNMQKGGLWQTYKKDPITGQGLWRDTTFKPGKLPKDVWNRIRLEYSFNEVAQTYSFETVEINDLPIFNFPAEFKNLKMTPLQWADGVALQIQLDINYKAGAYRTKMRRGSYIWS